MFVDNPQNSETVNVNGDSEISQNHDNSLEELIVNTNIIKMQTATPSYDLPGNSQSTREDNLSPAEDDQSPEPNIIYLNAVRAAEAIVLTCLKHVGK